MMPPHGLPVIVDPRRNTLRLLILPDERTARSPALISEATSTVSARGTLDVGENGRLLGLELEAADREVESVVDAAEREPPGDPWYLDLEDAPGDQLRSVPVVVTVGRDAAGRAVWVDLPRRGDGYELTFPSGNQCWVRPQHQRLR